MYDITKRDKCLAITVEDFIKKLESMPKDAIVTCCGDNLLYIHVEKDGSVVNIDTEDLDSEYADSPDVSAYHYWKYRETKQEG